MDDTEQQVPETTAPDDRPGSGEGAGAMPGPPPGTTGTQPPPPPQWAGAYQWAPAPVGAQATPERGLRRMIKSRMAGWVVAAGLACAVIGLSVVVATTPPTTQSPAVAGRVPSSGSVPGSGSFGGRFGLVSRGATGTVDSVSASSFTMTTGAGQKLTVDEQSSTTYRSGVSSASASAVTAGARVIVLGSKTGSTITATQVIVLPTGGGGFGFPGSSAS